MTEQAYSNEGRIAIFPNDKGNNPRRPDFRGTFQLDGVKYNVSLWKKTTRDGKNREYLAGQFERAKEGDPGAADTPKPAATQPAPTPPPQPTPTQTTLPGASNLEEDVPF